MEGGNDSIEKLENYSYFQGSLIKRSPSIPKKSFEEGEKLCSQGKLALKKVFHGFDRSQGEIRGRPRLREPPGEKPFQSILYFPA